MIPMRKTCLLALISVFALVHTARADSLFNNLGASTYSGYEITNGDLFADSFSTGKSTFNLDSLTFLLAVNGLSYPPGSDTITVELLSDSSTSPGSVLDILGTFDNSDLVSLNNEQYTLTTSPYTLARNTRYWIGLTTSNGTGGFGEWAQSPYTDGTTGTTGEYWTVIVPSLGSVDGGPDDQGGGAFQMEVSSSEDSPAAPAPGPAPPAPVPEPASYETLVVGLALGLAVLRNKDKQLGSNS